MTNRWKSDTKLINELVEEFYNNRTTLQSVIESLRDEEFKDFAIAYDKYVVNGEPQRTMNLYLIWQNTRKGYDTYDSAVVAAKSELLARETHPRGEGWPSDYRDGCSWVRIDQISEVKVELIGKAVKGTIAGVICASFNAG